MPVWQAVTPRPSASCVKRIDTRTDALWKSDTVIPSAPTTANLVRSL